MLQKFGRLFDDVLTGVGADIIRTPFEAPKANAHIERFIGSVRRECTDHVLVLGEEHLQRVLDEYCDYFNAARPHQGIEQRRPATSGEPACARTRATVLRGRPVFGDLHHDYYPAV